MTKGELAVLVKKVQAECGLEDPTKITYYRDEEGRVVFKLWFDSLILPETLAGKKKDEFEWQANVNNTFINNEPYLYDDDFTILEYNEEKGWVKVLPDQQDFEIVESYNKLIDSKDEDLVRLQGKKLSEKVAKAYSLTLYEAEDASDIKTPDSNDFIEDSLKKEGEGKIIRVDKPPKALFVVLACRFPGLIASELTGLANQIKAANAAGPNPVKVILINTTDNASLALYDYNKIAQIFSQGEVDLNGANFVHEKMENLVNAMTNKDVVDIEHSYVICSNGGREALNKHPTLSKIIYTEAVDPEGFEGANVSNLRTTLSNIEAQSEKAEKSVLEPLAKAVTDSYCKAAANGKIKKAKEVEQREESSSEKKEPTTEAARRLLKSILAGGKILQEEEEASVDADSSSESSEDSSSESSESESSEQNTENNQEDNKKDNQEEDKKEDKKEDKSSGDPFIDAWKKSAKRFDEDKLEPADNAMIAYFDYYVANTSGDIQNYYSQSEAKENLEKRNQAAEAAFKAQSDLKADVNSTAKALVAYGPLRAIQYELTKNHIKKDDFKKGDNPDGESKGFSFEQEKNKKAKKLSGGEGKPEKEEAGKLTPTDFHIYSLMDYEPQKTNVDNAVQYLSTEGINR